MRIKMIFALVLVDEANFPGIFFLFIDNYFFSFVLFLINSRFFKASHFYVKFSFLFIYFFVFNLSLFYAHFNGILV